MRLFIVTVMVLLTTGSAYACEVCGCSMGGNYFGILPQFHGHFVGLRYQYRSFRSEHVPLFSESEQLISHEYFQTAELWGRWNPSKKVQLFAFVPVNFMHKQEAGITTLENGLGDVSLVVNVVLLNTGDDIRKRYWRAIDHQSFPILHQQYQVENRRWQGIRSFSTSSRLSPTLVRTWATRNRLVLK